MSDLPRYKGKHTLSRLEIERAQCLAALKLAEEVFDLVLTYLDNDWVRGKVYEALAAIREALK